MSQQFVSSPWELLTRLQDNSHVKAILRYGAKPLNGAYLGDLDLFVITDYRPKGVESLHFYAGSTPVDLNIRSVADLEGSRCVSFIDEAMLQSDLLFDRNGDIASVVRDYCQRCCLEQCAALTTAEVAFTRFSHRHLLDKVRNRLDSEPLLCQFLLSTNIYWLTQTYFRLRQEPYPGEKAALNHLATHEPKVWDWIDEFFRSQDLSRRFSVTEELTELVLQPIGGPWRTGEVLVLAAESDAQYDSSSFQTDGETFFEALLWPSHS